MAYESEDVRVYLVVYLLSEWCAPVIKSIKKAKGAEPPGAWFYGCPTRWMWWMVTIRCLPLPPLPPSPLPLPLPPPRHRWSPGSSQQYRVQGFPVYQRGKTQFNKWYLHCYNGTVSQDSFSIFWRVYRRCCCITVDSATNALQNAHISAFPNKCTIKHPSHNS